MKKILCVLMLIISGLITYNANADADVDCPEPTVLIAYFSATGNTAKIAEKIYSVSNSNTTDLFEIKPAQPYTDTDLDWHNERSRSSVEMKDTTSRPMIATKVKNMNKYNIVFIGFPIWWGREPAIIDTFIESYDFTGKTIIPFATSGSSDIGDIYKNIQALAQKAYVEPGKRFAVDMSEEELEDLYSWMFDYVIPICVM